MIVPLDLELDDSVLAELMDWLDVEVDEELDRLTKAVEEELYDELLSSSSKHSHRHNPVWGTGDGRRGPWTTAANEKIDAGLTAPLGVLMSRNSSL